MNTNNPLSLGMIGGAVNSAVGYAHFCASQLDKRWTIQAGCFSRDIIKNQATGEAYKIDSERVYCSFDKLLKEEQKKLDAVVILTPTPTHFEIVSQCLKQKIPVICEKALVINSSEATQLSKLCKEMNGFLTVTYNYSGYPMVRELKNIIANGRLGKILHFQAEMPQEGFIRVDSNGNKPNIQAWRLSDGSEIPTIHLDLAVHLHQLIYYLTNENPIEVIANHATDGWFKNIVDNVGCLCNYTNNIQGQLWFSKSALGPRNGLKIRVFGSDGSAEWFQMNPEEIMLSFANGNKQVLDRASSVFVASQKRYERFKAGHPAGFIEAFANLYYDIADALIEYKSFGYYQSKEVFDVEFAKKGLLFLEAMSLSAHSKKWEDVV